MLPTFLQFSNSLYFLASCTIPAIAPISLASLRCIFLHRSSFPFILPIPFSFKWLFSFPLPLSYYHILCYPFILTPLSSLPLILPCHPFVHMEFHLMRANILLFHIISSQLPFIITGLTQLFFSLPSTVIHHTSLFSLLLLLPSFPSHIVKTFDHPYYSHINLFPFLPPLPYRNSHGFFPTRLLFQVLNTSVEAERREDQVLGPSVSMFVSP